MNERIKELAEQCWDRRLDGVHFDQEKFANLVAAHEREACATPPQRQWVGLTQEEMEELYESATYMDKTDCIHLLMLAADKLKEKNT